MTVATVSRVRGRARRAAVVVLVVAVLAACVPPPDQPIGGRPSYRAPLTLTSAVCPHPGTDCFYVSNLTHFATWDLGYQTVVVTGRVSVSSCSIDDWVDILVTARRAGSDRRCAAGRGPTVRSSRSPGAVHLQPCAGVRQDQGDARGQQHLHRRRQLHRRHATDPLLGQSAGL